MVAVLNDDEIEEYELSHIGQGLKYLRTTESGWNGIFYADFSIKAV